MAIPRLRLDDTALLAIDVQEKLVPTLARPERLVTNAAILLQAAAQLRIPYLVTEHYPKGLGRTVPEITAAMTDPSARVEKTRFSAAVDIVLDRLDRWQRGGVLIAGIEAHVCVLMTVLDLQARGHQCFVVADAIAASQSEHVEHALRRMEAAGAVTTSVMGGLYELIDDARHPARRAIVELVQAVRT